MRSFARSSLAAFLLLSSCSTYTVSVRNSDVAYGLRERSETVQLELDCPPNAAALDVAVDLCGVAGSAAFTLRDPNGKVVWNIVARGGRAEQRGELPAVAGEWRGELVLDGFSGDYAVQLAAHDRVVRDVRFEVTDVSIESAERGDDAIGGASTNGSRDR